MEYHEIGDRFEYNGVILEVVNEFVVDKCKQCFLFWNCKLPYTMNCREDTRKDGESIYYKLVEQCKPKDMEHKTEFMVAGTDKVFATHVGNVQSDEEIYGSLLDKLFTTYKAKNTDYGGAFAEMFDELGIDYAYGKLREKMNRIKVLRNKPNMVENEGLEDALLDTAGYAILTLVELTKRKGNDKSK